MADARRAAAPPTPGTVVQAEPDELEVLQQMVDLLESLSDPEAVLRCVFFLASKAGFTFTATANIAEEAPA